MEKQKFEVEINTLHIDMDNLFMHANTFRQKVGIFQVLTDKNGTTSLTLAQQVDSVKEIQDWLTNEDNYLFKVKNRDDVEDMIDTLERDDATFLNFTGASDEHAFYICVGKLLEKLKNASRGLIVNEYFDVVTEIPLTKTMYNFNRKTYVIGTY